MTKTTIQLLKETKEKLEAIKKNNETYDNVIADLLQLRGGVEIKDDTFNIKRDSIAISLPYFEFNNKDDEVIKNDVTFQMLKLSSVGDVYYANDDVDDDSPNGYVNTTAEVIYKKDDDVVLLVKEIVNVRGEISVMSEIHHYDLF